MAERDDDQVRQEIDEAPTHATIDEAEDIHSDTGQFRDENGPDGQGASDAVIASLDELVRFLVSHLVDEPDSVEISLERRGGAVHIQLRMPEEELGKVIGRGGRIAKAMRTVLLIAGSRHNVRVTLDIES